MIRGLGIDLVDVERFRRALARRPGLIDRLFTSGEREYAERRDDPTERYAVRFAAKEAALKSLGVGIGAADWHDIEVSRNDDGRPSLQVTGRFAELAVMMRIARFELSLTHSAGLAQAQVIALGGGGGGQHSDRRRMGEWRRRTGRTAEPLPALLRGGLIPIVTPEQMNAIDADAPEPAEELIARAGASLARHAVSMLGGTYGRRVVVLVGPGNNGNDGRDAARRLSRRGVRAQVVEIADAPAMLPACDLVIDAVFGTGHRSSGHRSSDRGRSDARPAYEAPMAPPGAQVLAVDIPSGVDGSTGPAAGSVLSAAQTLTFAALKPGLLFDVGAQTAGMIAVADIGLDVSPASAHLVGAAAVAQWLPERSNDTHKWASAVCIVAGGPGMEGAASLASRAALRGGAGYVRLASPGDAPMALPTEVVRHALPASGWARAAAVDLDRFRALVIGNGLGVDASTRTDILATLGTAAEQTLPTIVDADALTALAGLSVPDRRELLGAHTVLTPHDGEFARLHGSAPGPDRIGAARALATATGSVVLLKGSATVVAEPGGAVLVSTSGDARLATAGTGDVLAGLVGALLASGVDPFHAAAAGAFIHGRAGALGWRSGSVAGDLPWRLPVVRDELASFRP